MFISLSAYIDGPCNSSNGNSVDPDQTPQNAASDLSLHCLLKMHKNFYNIAEK